VSRLPVNVRPSTISKETRGLERKTQALKLETGVLDTRVTSVEGELNALTPRVTTLETTVASLFPTTKEELVLASAQVIVTFSTINASESVFYIGGYGVDKGRLHDSEYTVDSSTQITLAESYPAGTTIFGVKNDR
tara:strand:- start:348 stop:755 length:408 start_codon:yes stop_codon:yes gene_type:complete